MIRVSPPELEREWPGPQASSRVTRAPRRRSSRAVQPPNAPAPMTTMGGGADIPLYRSLGREHAMPAADRSVIYRTGGELTLALPLGEELAQGDRAEARHFRFPQEGAEILGVGSALKLGVEGEDRPGGSHSLLHHGREIRRRLREGVPQGLVQGREGGGDLGRLQGLASYDREERLGAPTVGGVGEIVGLLVE